MGTIRKNILFIQLDGLGEIYLTLPLYKRIRQLHPEHNITIFSTKNSKDILREYADNIIEIDPPRLILNQHKSKFSLKNYLLLLLKIKKLRETNFDLIIDFKRYSHEILITSLLRGKEKIDYFKLKKWEKSGMLPFWKNIYVINERFKIYSLATKEKMKPRHHIISKLSKNKDYIVLAPFSSNPQKDIPIKDIFKIIKQNYKKQIFLTGTKEDIEKSILCEKFNNVINLVGKISLLEFEKLIKESSRLISADSLGVHIGYLNKIPIEMHVNKKIFYEKRFKPRKNCLIKEINSDMRKC